MGCYSQITVLIMAQLLKKLSGILLFCIGIDVRVKSIACFSKLFHSLYDCGSCAAVIVEVSGPSLELNHNAVVFNLVCRDARISIPIKVTLHSGRVDAQ